MMVGAIEFVQHARKVCANHQNCEDCPLYEWYSECNKAAIEDACNIAGTEGEPHEIVRAVEKAYKELKENEQGR